MKMTLKSIGKIALVLWALVVIVDIIYGLFVNTTDTLLGLCVMVGLGLLISLHVALKEKNYVEWKCYPELSNICIWLYISSLFLLVIFIISCALFTISFSLLILSAFSFWTYFSLILAKKNARFLLISYLLSLVIYLLLPIMKVGLNPIELHLNSICEWNNLFSILGVILWGLIIALCIQGLIITMNPKVKELFKDYNISYIKIAIVSMILISMIRMYNTTITLNPT